MHLLHVASSRGCCSVCIVFGSCDERVVIAHLPTALYGGLIVEIVDRSFGIDTGSIIFNHSGSLIIPLISRSIPFDVPCVVDHKLEIIIVVNAA